MKEISSTGMGADAFDEQAADTSKYRPSSELDFKRYARCVADLLDCPLQQAQELLARAYRYEHLHELQQTLKVHGVAGPFEDQMHSQGVKDPIKSIEIRMRRHDRLGQAYLVWLRDQPRERSSESDDMLLWDLGLFSSPKKQKVAAKQVKAFRKSRAGFSMDGFPYGFNGILHSRYRTSLPLEDAAFEKAQTELPFTSGFILHPDRQLDLLRARRACKIFIEMALQAAPEFGQAEPQVELETDWFTFEGEYPELLQPNFDEMIAHFLGNHYAPANVTLMDELEDDLKRSRVLQALAEPVADNIAKSPLCSQVDDLAACLPRWRLSLRLQLAQRFDEDGFEEDFSNHEGPVKLIESCTQGHMLQVLLRKIYMDLDVSKWELHAVLMSENAAGRWEPAGALFGDYLVPTNEETNRYALHGDVISYFDDRGDRDLLRVWQMLQKVYLPRTGFASYEEWVNDFGSGALANVYPWVAPEHRGTDASKHLFNLLASAFEVGATSWDCYWKSWFSQEDESDDVEGDDEEFMPGIGPLFISLPGTGLLGFSIWEGDAEAPTAHLLREDGHRLAASRSLRRYPGRFPERTKRGLGNRLLSVLKPLPGDYIFYDSEEAAEGGDRE